MSFARMLLMVEYYINLGLSVILLGLALWALTVAATAPARAYEAAFKRSKGFWCGVTGACVLGALMAAWSSFSYGSSSLFIQLLVATTIGVFLADVRPAVTRRS